MFHIWHVPLPWTCSINMLMLRNEFLNIMPPPLSLINEKGLRSENLIVKSQSVTIYDYDLLPANSQSSEFDTRHCLDKIFSIIGIIPHTFFLSNGCSNLGSFNPVNILSLCWNVRHCDSASVAWFAGPVGQTPSSISTIVRRKLSAVKVALDNRLLRSIMIDVKKVRKNSDISCRRFAHNIAGHIPFYASDVT